MSDYINVEEGKRNRQKPPRNLGRIACQILTGAGTAAALAYLSLYVVGYGAEIAGLGEGCMDGFLVLGMMAYVVPPFYILGCVVGVYLVGSRGNQTGSFLATLGGVFLGLPVIALLCFYMWAVDEYMTLGIEKIFLWPLVFLAAPAMATICFNLTRRYKQPPAS
ncbi:MAG: hypothetical protein JSW47_04190 [Phycisphaerales bacterium]|nr:MAG: hypothetical protein JSW47_04190 [Phycisphaerales bacterium]